VIIFKIVANEPDLRKKLWFAILLPMSQTLEGSCNLQECCLFIFRIASQVFFALVAFLLAFFREIINLSDSAQINHDVSYVPMK
jgi:hypothetical protein